MIITQVDDSSHTLNGLFVKESKIKFKRIDSKRQIYEYITFDEITIGKERQSFLVHQQLYTSNLNEFPTDCRFDLFRSKRHEVEWALHTRPHFSAAAERISQVTQNDFYKESDQSGE